jgi:hypothetical protein
VEVSGFNPSSLHGMARNSPETCFWKMSEISLGSTGYPQSLIASGTET